MPYFAFAWDIKGFFLPAMRGMTGQPQNWLLKNLPKFTACTKVNTSWYFHHLALELLLQWVPQGWHHLMLQDRGVWSLSEGYKHQGKKIEITISKETIPVSSKTPHCIWATQCAMYSLNLVFTICGGRDSLWWPMASLLYLFCSFHGG